MLTLIADAMMTATRNRRGTGWDVPDHWRQSEGLKGPIKESHYREDQRLMRWFEVTGPR